MTENGSPAYSAAHFYDMVYSMFDKSEIRKAIFHSSGCDADDWLEGARRSNYAFEGAKKALLKSSQEVASIALMIKKDLEEGKLDGMDPSQVADYAILQVTRSRISLENGSKHYANQQLATQGEIAAYERVVNHFKSLYEREDEKIIAREEAVESGAIFIEDDGSVSKSGRGRITGVRPAMGVAAQRKAQDAEEAASDKVDTASDEPLKRKKRKSKKDKIAEADESGVAKAEDGTNT